MTLFDVFNTAYHLYHRLLTIRVVYSSAAGSGGTSTGGGGVGLLPAPRRPLPLPFADFLGDRDRFDPPDPPDPPDPQARLGVPTTHNSEAVPATVSSAVVMLASWASSAASAAGPVSGIRARLAQVSAGSALAVAASTSARRVAGSLLALGTSIGRNIGLQAPSASDQHGP